MLHLLVLSQKFELAPSFISSSFSDSDAVKWIYTPTKEKIDESSQEPSQERTIDSQTSSIVPLRSSVSKLLEREKSAKSGMTPPPISLSKLFIDDADWSMDAAIPGSFNDIDMDAGDDYDNNELSIPAEPPKPKPALFGGLSIESMYSMWMQADESDDDEERPKKRTKTTENEESVATEGIYSLQKENDEMNIHLFFYYRKTKGQEYLQTNSNECSIFVNFFVIN